MSMLASVLVALVAATQFWCMIMEIFLWRTPIGIGNYHMTQEFADASATLAASKGLYQGLIAAGLVWSLFAGAHGFALQVFCLASTLAAGVYCAATVGRRFLYLQSAPAAVALALALATQ